MKTSVSARLRSVDGLTGTREFELPALCEPPPLLEIILPIPKDIQIDDLLDRPKFRLYSLVSSNLILKQEDTHWYLANYKEVL